MAAVAEGTTGNIMTAWLYLILIAFAAIGFVVSICGAMNDSNNRYPLPLLIAAVIAAALSQLLIR